MGDNPTKNPEPTVGSPKLSNAQRIRNVNNKFHRNIESIEKHIKSKHMRFMCSSVLNRMYPSYQEGATDLDHEIVGIIEAYKQAWKEEDNRQTIEAGGSETANSTPWVIRTSKSSFYPVGQLLVDLRNEAIQDCILYHRGRRSAYQTVNLAESDDSDVDADMYEKEMAEIFKEYGVEKGE